MNTEITEELEVLRHLWERIKPYGEDWVLRGLGRDAWKGYMDTKEWYDRQSGQLNG